jgi:hypothetical protein
LDIILSRDVEKFIVHLQKKRARQIVVKIKELSQTGHVQDSKILQDTKKIILELILVSLELFINIKITSC